MTQSVTFHFTSPQFVLESGIVTFTKGARLFSDGEFQVGTIKDGSVEGVLVEGPIEFDAMLGDLTVVWSEDSRRYHVGFLNVTGNLQPEHLRSGCVVVRLDLTVILIVRVEDQNGHPVPNVSVNLTLPKWEATLEAQTDARGEIVLLAGAGKYAATLNLIQNRRARPDVSADVTIVPSHFGERRVVLRIPKPSALSPK
jgi:hypothetical protein